MTDLLWGNALAVVPLALMVAPACRFLPCRPATRHAMWLTVMLCFVLPSMLPRVRILEGIGSAPAAEQASRPKHAVVAEIGLTEPRPSLLPELLALGRARSEPPPLSVVGSARKPTPPPRSATAIPRPFDGSHASAGPGRSPGPAVTPDAARSHSPAMTERSGNRHAPPAEPPDDRFAAVVRLPPPKSPGAGAGQGTSQGRRWLRALLALGDGWGRLPRMPTGVWLGGMVVFATIRLVRVAHARRLLRNAVPAPPSVTRIVAEVAAGFGLRRVPQTWMVRAEVSPMIWCGRPVRLILPRRLWSELDPTGRRAILCHELAHLRRLDHWVCRGEVLVRGLFWWHPLVWWVAHRLREEAELCCDAWVTWLMPRSRREYARALLKTKEYVSHARIRMPAVGMGAMTARARRFARRLKMVMTKRTRPGLSLTGFALAIAVMTAGWLVSPAHSCEPKSESAKKDKRPATPAVLAPKSPEQPAVSAVPPLPPLPAMTAEELNTFEEHVAHRKQLGAPAPPGQPATPAPGIGRARFMPALLGEPAQPVRPDRPDRKGKDDIEARLERLERQMERLMERLERLDRPEGRPGRERAPQPPRPEVPPQPPPEGEQIVVRAYRLPEGKLKALSELMIRPDVPIRVQPTPDRIEVHATERQHRVFRAFVRLIHPEAGGEEAEADKEVVAPRAERAAGDVEDARRAMMEELERAREAARGQLEEQREALEEMRRALERQQRELERQQREIEKQREALERQRAKMEEQHRKSEDQKARSEQNAAAADAR